MRGRIAHCSLAPSSRTTVPIVGATLCALLAASLAAPAEAANPRVKIFRGPEIHAPDQQQPHGAQTPPAQPRPLEARPLATRQLDARSLETPPLEPRAQQIESRQIPSLQTQSRQAPPQQAPAAPPQAISSDTAASDSATAPDWQAVPGFQLALSRAFAAEVTQTTTSPSRTSLSRTSLSRTPAEPLPQQPLPQQPLPRQTLSRRLQGQPLPIQWSPATAEPLAPPLPHEDAFETIPAVDYARQPLRQPGRQTAAVQRPHESYSFATPGPSESSSEPVSDAAWGNDHIVRTPAAPNYSGASRDRSSAARDSAHVLRDAPHPLRDNPAAWHKSTDSPRIYTFASSEGSPVPDYDSVALRNDKPSSPSPAQSSTPRPAPSRLAPSRSGPSQFATSLFAKDGPEPIADDYNNLGSNHSDGNNSGSNNSGNPFGDSDASGSASSDLIDDGSFLSGESGACGSNGGCETCGSDDCDGSCNPCYAPYGLSAAVEATYLKPHYRSSNDQFDVANNFNYEAAPRVWIQWQNKNGWGLRGRYWDYDADQQASSVITEEDAIAVFNSADNLRLYAVDLELTRTFMLGATQTVASIGARNGQFRRNITQQISIFDFAGGGADDASAILRNIDRTFNGTGLTFGLGFRRPVAGTRLSAVCNLRGSVLWGGDNFNYNLHVVEVVPVGVGDLDLNDNTQLTSTGSNNSGMWIGELQAGGEWNTPISNTFGGGNAFVRVLFEGQWWNLPSVIASNDITLNSQVYDFLGVTAAIGFTR